MLLIAPPLGFEQAAGFQAFQLTLNGARATAGQCNEFVGKEGSFRLPKEIAKNALLSGGKQGVAKSGFLIHLNPLNKTHIGVDCTHFGHRIGGGEVGDPG